MHFQLGVGSATTLPYHTIPYYYDSNDARIKLRPTFNNPDHRTEMHSLTRHVGHVRTPIFISDGMKVASSNTLFLCLLPCGWPKEERQREVGSFGGLLHTVARILSLLHGSFKEQKIAMSSKDEDEQAHFPLPIFPSFARRVEGRELRLLHLPFRHNQDEQELMFPRWNELRRHEGDWRREIIQRLVHLAQQQEAQRPNDSQSVLISYEEGEIANELTEIPARPQAPVTTLGGTTSRYQQDDTQATTSTYPNRLPSPADLGDSTWYNDILVSAIELGGRPKEKRHRIP